MTVDADLYKAALDYHQLPRPGKIGTHLTKPGVTQRDLSLAYSPGVAEPCRLIAKDPQAAYLYTNKGHLVAVISNGTAVLGLGNIGALASKPVMEGKAFLFHLFSGLDAIDIELDVSDPNKFIEVVCALEPSFGAINLEDIKAPECFYIERELKKRLSIPVMHDDQHGTAITIAAALENALEVQQKDLSSVTVACIGAGAAGIASMDFLVKRGLKKENIYLLDRQGLITSDRAALDEHKARYAQTPCHNKTLRDVIAGKDVFIGLSEGNLLDEDMVRSMADKPVILAMANPDPEITPQKAFAARSDLIMATGRSDYPNQVNNVLCFPYIFKGALEASARCINEDMMFAVVEALKELTHEPVPDQVLRSYNLTELSFGKDYILPKPIDSRLNDKVSKAVARAARASGVARS